MTKRRMQQKKKRIEPAKIASKEVSFEFYAPLSEQVAVAGTFNGWNPMEGKLQRMENGFWKGTFNIAPGRYEYRFWVDGHWENDQKPVEKVLNAFGGENCILEV